jgi:hypothetical protein
MLFPMKSLVLGLLALAAPLLGGELQPSQVPDTAKWQLHADFDAMRASVTGKAVFARIEAEHGTQLRAFKRMFSIHPLHDLRGITLFGDGRPDHAVALIDGRFNRGHLEDVVRAADAYQATTHGDLTIHHWQDQGVAQHAAFAREDLLVFSRQRELLHQALDTLATRIPAERDPFFAELGGKPLVAASIRLSEIEIPGDAARLVRMAKTLRLAAHEHDGRFTVRTAVETADTTDADRLRRMLDGVIALAEAGDATFDGLDLRSEVRTDDDRPGMTGSLSLPVLQWLMLLERAAAADVWKDPR